MTGAVDDHGARFDERDPDTRFVVESVEFDHEQVGVLAGDRPAAVEAGRADRPSTGAD